MIALIVVGSIVVVAVAGAIIHRIIVWGRKRLSG